ncbi:MAG: DNA polymerase subunit beta [Methanosarcinales archaeon]|nr:DNA polymerase subunit beta [Methanosarcinales archaeon]
MNKARIRDFLETKDHWIFAVADYQHPQGFRSLLRYVPDPAGERARDGIRYRKVDFDESYQVLREQKPDYVKDMHVVPASDVLRLYSPSAELPRVAAADARLNKIVTILTGAGVPLDQMGITGSMLLGLNAPSSDIDFVVYGPWWWKARDVIARAKEDGQIQELDEGMWQKIYAKRRPDISYREFVAHEIRKGNRGMVDQTYFDLLFTRDWSQIEPLEKGREVGRGKVVAEVTDATFAFDSPGILKLDHEVGEILCYSHTYAGQARVGETVEAVGVLEETSRGQRLVVGTTREARGEWIRSLTLLDELDT